MDAVEEFALYGSFSWYRDFTPDEGPRGVTVDSGLYRHFLSIDMRGDTYEVPCVFARMAVELREKGFDKLVIPLFSSNSCRDASMLNSILKYINRTDFFERLRGVRTSKGEIYYGCPGLLLDSNFQPLLVTTVVVNNAGRISEMNCRIPHCVFQRQNELIPKAIYKKFIPLYGTTAIETRHVNSMLGTTRQNVEIKIGMGANIVFATNTPKPSNATEEDFARILRDNVDSFV